MTPVTVTGRVNPRTLARIGAARRVSGDNYKGAGETSAATTWTLTAVVTVGSTPGSEAITLDYAST